MPFATLTIKMPLNEYQRGRIVALWTQCEGKWTLAQMRRILALEGIITTSMTISNTISRWHLTKSTRDCPKSGPPAKVPESHSRCIDDTMADNDELTASDLKDILIKEFGVEKVQYGERTIARIRNELGWTFTTARYCQAIRDANKQKRLDWCTKLIAEKEKFDDVIFTDESTFQLECHRRKCFRKKNMPRKMKYKHKHPPKIHVWAGISKKGATQIVMFSGIMNATRYSDILSASLVPFLKEMYPHGHRLYQDNDPKHTSKYIQCYFEANGVNWWKSPAESPDLNPIELMWGSMKNFIRDKLKPKNLGELKEGIRKYWSTLTPEVCTRYIDHLQKVMPVVVQVEGAPSGH